MAINESIPLQVQVPGIMGAAMGSLQAGQQFNVRALKFAHDTAVQLKAAPIEQRAQIASTALPQLQKMGVDVQGMNLDQHLDDSSLDSFISATKPYTVATGQAPSKSVVGNQLLFDEGGKSYTVNTVFDRDSGTFKNVKTEAGPSSSLINRMGQTAETAYDRALRLDQEKKAFEAQKALEVAGGKSAIELNQAAAMTPILGVQEATKAASKDQVALEGDIINQGVSAAENLPRLEETLDLMKKINTGGFNKWSKAIADRFGMDTSNESLVQSTFSSNIVELLQQNKGTQTKADQELIEKTGPNFDLGSKSNIELLKRVVSRNKTLKQRALETAKKRQEYGTALETLTRDYSYKPETVAPTKPAPAAKTEVNWGDL